MVYSNLHCQQIESQLFMLVKLNLSPAQGLISFEVALFTKSVFPKGRGVYFSVWPPPLAKIWAFIWFGGGEWRKKGVGEREKKREKGKGKSKGGRGKGKGVKGQEKGKREG